jgi:hypothetical protein
VSGTVIMSTNRGVMSLQEKRDAAMSRNEDRCQIDTLFTDR